MPISNRPYVGSWQMNRTLVRHTPDVLVYINGVREFAVCPTCNKTLDVNKYITQVSVDGTTESIATANLSLSIPRHELDVFSHDGNMVLQNNLEVVILMRGYFPMKNFGGKGQDPSNEEGFNADEVPLHPYYQVFRGVVTNVSHGYSGGFYNATLQCGNLLHFWQNLKLSVNGSVFGRRPLGSMVEPSLVGHKFTGANPYSIIYTLVKVGFGAAYGVDFTFARSANVSAVDDDERKSLFAHAAEWWEKRWTEHSGNLRMYGIDGTVFNAFEQAYLGRWYDTRNKAEAGNAFYQTAKTVYSALRDANDFNMTRSRELLQKARELAYDPYALNAAVYNTDGQGGKFATEDILRMQAFTLDIGKMGSVNMFETEYMSKLEIAEAVKAITGYEFYQDVDGDLVFKPPMYNLDTRSDPVYRISDRDLISIDEVETEPEATMMKGTGSHFSNITGHGIDGWLGVGAVYIDYRLVAKYGYREETFETNYMNNKQALFVSAMNRLDLANAGVRSATITIPLRPELRPGYPVYVEFLDCFYYVKSLSHSFAFGGQCTTTINGVAKRAKWLPPMESRGDGKLPSIQDVRLDSPGEFPKMPLYAFPHYLTPETSDDETGRSAGPPRIIGFPNVVMALDPDKINLDTVDLKTGALSAGTYVQLALASGFLERGPTNPSGDQTFILRSSNEGGETVTLAQVQQEWADVADALGAGTYVPDNSTTLGRIIQAIEERSGTIDTPESKGLVNFLALQTSLKSSFSPGTSIAGKYRYFSCSHPDSNHQAPGNLFVDQEAGEINITAPNDPDEGFTSPVLVLKDVGEGKGLKAEKVTGVRGIQIASFSQKEDSDEIDFKTETVRTSDIRFVTFGPQVTRKQYRVSYVDNGRSKGWNFGLNPGETKGAFAVLLRTRSDSDPSKTVAERFGAEYDRIWESINTYAANLGVTDNSRVNRISGLTDSASKALDNYTRLPNGSADKVTQGPEGIYNRKSDPEAVEALSSYLADALWAYTNQVTSSARRVKGFDGNYLQFMRFRTQFIEDYTAGGVQVPDSDPAKAFFFADEYKETADWTPIFPVSDASGFEVFGNLPYGRGVDIERYAQLVQSKTTGDQTDSGPEASEASITLVGTSGGANASSLQAIERFFAAYLLTEDVDQILSSDLLSSADKAALLATLNTTEEGLQGAVETLVYKQDSSEDAKIRNAPVTSFFRGQSVFGDTAARNLANLDLTEDLCACKGADAAFFMQAFSEEFIEQFPENPAQGYAEQQAYEVGESYKATRDALSGRAVDTRTNLAREFTARGNTARSLSSAFQNLEDGLSAQAAATQAAINNLTDGEG